MFPGPGRSSARRGLRVALLERPARIGARAAARPGDARVSPRARRDRGARPVRRGPPGRPRVAPDERHGRGRAPLDLLAELVALEVEAGRPPTADVPLLAPALAAAAPEGATL